MAAMASGVGGTVLLSVLSRTTKLTLWTCVGEPARPMLSAAAPMSSAVQTGISRSWAARYAVERRLGLELGPALAERGVLARGRGQLARDLAADRGRAGRVGRAHHRQQAGHLAADDLRAGVEGALGGDPAVGDLQDGLRVGDLRDAELLRRLRADLGRVAVDGLAPGQDEVVAADLLDRLLEGEGGGQGVGSGEPAIGQQDHPVRPAPERLAQDVGRLRRAHRDHGDRPAVIVPDLERHLEGVQVLRVEDGRQRVAVHRAVFGHHLAGDVVRVGHLLDQDHAVDRSGVGHPCLRRSPAGAGTGVAALGVRTPRGAGSRRPRVPVKDSREQVGSCPATAGGCNVDGWRVGCRRAAVAGVRVRRVAACREAGPPRRHR